MKDKTNLKHSMKIKLFLITLAIIIITILLLPTSTIAAGISDLESTTPPGMSGDLENSISKPENTNDTQKGNSDIEVEKQPITRISRANDGFVLVDTFAKLKASVNAGETKIRMTANIDMKEILRIPNNLVLDGGGFTLSETPQKFTFGIQSHNAQITFQNMKIIGYSFYGPVNTAASSTGTSNGAVVKYINVVYNGPKLGYLIKNNTLIVENSTINIRSNGAGSDAVQEFAQVPHVVLAGDVQITKHETATKVYSFIWFYNSIASQGASFTVKSGANVNIQNKQTYFYYNDVVIPGIDFIVEDRAKLYMEMYEGWAYNSSPTYHDLKDVRIGEDAYVELVHTKGGYGPGNSLAAGTEGSTMNVKGNILIKNNATFIMRNSSKSNLPQLNFITGIKNITIEDPKLVFIGGKQMGIKPQSVNISAKTINVWGAGFDPLVNYPWIKLNESGVLNTQGPTEPGAITTLTDTNSKFNYFSSSSLGYLGTAIGQYDFKLSPIPTIKSKEITGSSSPATTIDMAYEHKTQSGILHKRVNAKEDGSFIFEVGEGLKGTGLTFDIAQPTNVVANLKIYAKEIWDFVEGGVLELKEVPNIEFGVQTIPVSNIRLGRTSPAQIVIEDSRSNAEASKWDLLVQASSLIGTTSEGVPYIWGEDALGYMDNNIYKSLRNKVLVWSSETKSEAEQTLNWLPDDSENGIVLEVDSLEAKTGEYTATLTWTLEIAP